MADLEKIIRPHLPANIAPTNTTSRCQSAPPPTVAKFSTNAVTASGAPSPVTVTSSWSLSYKTYMTAKQKEVDKQGQGAQQNPPTKP